MKFRFWLFSLLLFSAIFGEAKPQPNIVVVLVDDHAFEAISAYGTYLKDHAKTPAIDLLAKEGMRFDNFVCCNSICSPSRAAILTGQYSHKNGVKGLGGRSMMIRRSIRRRSRRPGIKPGLSASGILRVSPGDTTNI